MIDAGSKVLGSMLGGARTTTSGANPYTTATFDNSGWNVNLGPGSIDSARSQSGTSWQVYALVALGLVVALKVMRK